MKDFTIRQATKDDIPKIVELWEQMVNEARGQWLPNKDIWAAMAVQLMQSGMYHLLVAEEKGEMIGFIDGMMFNEPSTGKMHGVGQHFFIKPEHRKSMVGGELYREIMVIALSKGAEILEFFCFPEMIKEWVKRGFFPARILMRREVNV